MVNKHTVARTIRLDPEIDRILKHEAQQLGLTHTAVAAMALRKYAKYDRFAEKIGSLTIPRETLSRMLQFLSEEEAGVVGSVANFAGNNSRQFMNLLLGHSSIHDYIDLLRILSEHAHMFELEHRPDGSKHHLIFMHTMGSKWSSFLQGAVQATLREVYGIRARFERTESFLSCLFEERS
jgi:hypothetical protein